MTLSSQSLRLLSQLLSLKTTPSVVSDFLLMFTDYNFDSSNLEIVNGERNRINLLIENLSDLNVTLLSVAGSIHDAKTDAVIKNVSPKGHHIDHL